MSDEDFKLSHIFEEVCFNLRDDYFDAIERFETESPIERLVFAAFKIKSQVDLHEFTIALHEANKSIVEAVDQCSKWNPLVLRIYPQCGIGPYFADFALMIRDEIGSRPSVVIVECDGHDFHERTKEQAAHDRRRDRYFVELGYKVLRFTGSEIWKDPQGCVDQALHIAMTPTFDAAAHRDYQRSQSLKVNKISEPTKDD